MMYQESEEDKEGEEVEKDFSGYVNPIEDICNEDQLDRIKKRKEEQEYFDILLSGTTATLIIQLPKRMYIGFVGDTMVTMQGNKSST